MAATPLAMLWLAGTLHAEDRITVPVDETQRVTLAGHVSPRLAAATDQGAVDASMQLPYLMMVLAPSASQLASLTQLLEEQQTPGSRNYHAWLTPEEYGARFGASQKDIDKLVNWLRQRGLTVKSVARGRNTIAFGGSAEQVSSAFQIEIHKYLYGGALHYANAGEPTVPAAFGKVVQGMHGLTDFRLQPMSRRSLKPRFDYQGGHAIGPDDIATIYDIAPLYSAGIDGTGQTLAVVGQTDIQISDITNFRTQFGLPAMNLQQVLVPGSQDPGVQSQSGDLAESDLDLELSGAVARNATIQFVYSTDAIVSLQYAIDSDVAPVVSVSYGDCELQTPSTEAQQFSTWAMQANAQGQTVFASAGDSGALDCSGGDDPTTNNQLSVDLPASVPYVTGVGGTEFSEGSGKYWNNSNTSSGESAISYIPEGAWNDGVCEGPGNQQSLCATGGGVSIYFSKPSWQTGTGVPSNSFRNVPDVAISASPNHDPYVIFTSGALTEIGGTSAGSPQWAGIATLLNHYLVSKGYQASAGLGNINPAIYQNLAPVSGVFHDITSGNNMVEPCTGNKCSGTPMGYATGTGYDQVTGWGTPDVNALISAWHSSGVTAKSSVSVTLSANPTRPAFTDTVTITAGVTSSGSAPGGTVMFTLGSETLGTAAVSSGTATLAFNATELAVGANTITAAYSGDDTHFSGTASVNVIESTPANGIPVVTSVANSGSYTNAFAPGGIVSIFGSSLAPASAGAFGLPLPTMLAGTKVTIGGYTAALYYVSSGQLNVQIPYEVTAGSSAQIHITNNGESSNAFFTPAAAAPAIFTTNASGSGQGAILNTSYQLVDSSNPAVPGTTYLQIFCMGLGAVTNPPADGAAALSSPLSQTSSEAQVTIGGVQTTASFTGLAPGFVGLYQVNVLVPSTVQAGSAVPVSLMIGGATSNTVTIAVQ